MIGYLIRNRLALDSQILRHIGPNHIESNGFLKADLFVCRSKESQLSWRKRCGVLSTEQGLKQYRVSHEFPYDFRKVGKKICRPGIAMFTVSELLDHDIKIRFDPEPRILNGRKNTYWNLHYRSGCELPLETRAALCELINSGRGTLAELEKIDLQSETS